MHWRGRSIWYNPRIFRILHIRLLQISRHRNPYLQGHIGRIFPTRNALLDVRRDHPWHCQVSFASPFAENLTLLGIVDLSLGTMIWTFASGSRSLLKKTFWPPALHPGWTSLGKRSSGKDPWGDGLQSGTGKRIFLEGEKVKVLDIFYFGFRCGLKTSLTK